eukprot:SAG22_NODE_695_length_7843_cov_2.924587_2_plen_159_part_00
MNSPLGTMVVAGRVAASSGGPPAARCMSARTAAGSTAAARDPAGEAGGAALAGATGDMSQWVQRSSLPRRCVVEAVVGAHALHVARQAQKDSWGEDALQMCDEAARYGAASPGAAGTPRRCAIDSLCANLQRFPVPLTPPGGFIWILFNSYVISYVFS